MGVGECDRGIWVVDARMGDGIPDPPQPFSETDGEVLTSAEAFRNERLRSRDERRERNRPLGNGLR